MERVNITPNGDTITILHGNVRVHQFDGTDYKLRSMDAVIELVRERGSDENTVVFYNKSKVQVILDDTLMNRPQDRATYSFEWSDAFDEWRAIFGKPQAQKDFVDFLRRRPVGEVLEIESLIATVQRLNLVTEIVGDYQYDDNNNITFMFKSKDGEGSAKLPRIIIVNITLLNESAKVFDLEVELELRKPKSENEKPLFVLTCPKLQRYTNEAVDYEIKRMKEALDGYLILAGSIE